MKFKIPHDLSVLTSLLAQRLFWALRDLRWFRNLALIFGSKLLLLDVRHLQRSDSSYRQLEEGKGSWSSSYSVWESDSQATRHETVAPIGMWKVLNGEVYSFSKFPLIRAKGSLLLPPSTEAGPYNLYPNAIPAKGFQVLRHEADVVLARIPSRPILVDACTYVGTRSPHNWSHWLINFLPGVMVASDFFGRQQSPPLLVSSGFRNGEARSSLFDYFWPERSTLLCQEDDLVKSNEIYWFEQPYSDSPRPAFRGNLKPKFANRSIMTEFRSRLLRFAKDSDSGGEFPEKIFLARENAMSRPYNQDEVHAVAIDLGYEVVYLNRMPIAQQIALVASADRIVGPTGSAFASTIVAKRGARLLELSAGTKQDKVEDWYAPLADVAGAEYRITFTPFRYDEASRAASFDTDTIARYLSSL